MISSIFHSLLYKPFYNILVYLTGVLPGSDIGWAVIVLTIFVLAILLPLRHKQANTQRQMKAVESEQNKIKKDYADNSAERNKRIIELYNKHGINPFAGFALIFIQIPVMLALYFVFTRGIPFTNVDLYSFVTLPTGINSIFLGLLDLTTKSIPLALLVALTQYIQVNLALPPIAPRTEGEGFGQDFARSMNTNMKYVMPAMIGFFAASFPSVVGLYWLTNNIFGIAHELYVKRKATQVLK